MSPWHLFCLIVFYIVAIFGGIFVGLAVAVFIIRLAWSLLAGL